MSMKRESQVECKICGEIFHCRVITLHLKKKHNFNKEDFKEYHFKYLRDKNEGICKCKNCTNRTTIRMSGIGLKIIYNKFCEKHAYCSRLSPVNIKYWQDIFGLNEKQAKEKASPYIEKNAVGLRTKRKDGGFYIPTQIEYWLEKTNGNEKIARQKLSERQTTFSKKKCIKEHGKEKGIRVWKERQKKWQQTMCDKPIEEIERINKAKMFKYSYSKISQELFVEIYNKIQKEFSFEDVYFATLKRDGTINDDGNNDEYFLPLGNGKHRLLDFYIPSLKKCIEFDGHFWHEGEGSEWSGNKERDILREQQIKDNDIEILHIKEMRYKNDPELTIQKCVEFLLR
jgi:hypothetical protein